MGYYKSKIEEYRQATPDGATLAQRMEAVKKSYEEVLDQRLSNLRKDYYMNCQLDPKFKDEELAKNLSQAQKVWGQTVLQSTADFFAQAVQAEKSAVWEHMEQGVATCDETRNKLLRIERGEGFVGSIGKVISPVKNIATDNLNATLQTQQQELSGVVNAYQEFYTLEPSEKLEYVVGHYEQTGTFEYNPQAVVDFYKQNPVETTTLIQTPDEQ